MIYRVYEITNGIRRLVDLTTSIPINFNYDPETARKIEVVEVHTYNKYEIHKDEKELSVEWLQ